MGHNYYTTDINGDKNIVIQNNDGSEITLNIHNSEDMKRLFLEFRYVIYELSHDIRQIISQKHPNLYQKHQHLNGIPYYNSEKLVGRDDKLEEIHKIINGKEQTICLNGIGGIGKTTLAKAYVNDNKYCHCFDHIAWVTISSKNPCLDFIIALQDLSSTSKNIINELRNQDRDINIKDNLEVLLSKLKEEYRKGNNLLIIDNANNEKQILELIEQTNTLRWKTIITSRSKLNDIPSVDVDKLPKEIALKMFYRYYEEENNEHNKEDNEALNKLLKHIEYHTLLIELLAKVGKNHPDLTIPKIYELFKNGGLGESGLNLIISTGEHGSHQDEKLFQYILSVFELENISGNEEKYLRYFSFLPPQEYSFEKLKLLFQIEEKDSTPFANDLNKLFKKGWIQKYSKNVYRMLPIINLVLNYKLKPNDTNCRPIIESIIQHLKKGGNVNHLELLPYAIHIHNQEISSVKSKYKLANNISKIYRYLHEFEISLKYAKSALNVLEDKVKNEKSNRNFIKFIKAINITYRITFNYYIHIARVYKNMASIYRGLKDFDKALYYSKEALKRQNLFSILKNKNDEIIDSYINVGKIYTAQEEYDLGQKYFDKSIYLAQKSKDKKVYYLYYANSNIGFAYTNQEKFNEAIPYLEIAKQQGEIWGNNKMTPSLAATYLSLAVCYYKEKKIVEASYLINKVVTYRKHYYPANHPYLKNALKWEKKIEKVSRNKNEH